MPWGIGAPDRDRPLPTPVRKTVRVDDEQEDCAICYCPTSIIVLLETVELNSAVIILFLTRVAYMAHGINRLLGNGPLKICI